MATGDLVAIFDCDHLPTRSFLQMTVGWFYRGSPSGRGPDPHHFFSADPFRTQPATVSQDAERGALFYGLVQDGNDMGRQLLLRFLRRHQAHRPRTRSAASRVETVTEDAHTSLRLHRLGYLGLYPDPAGGGAGHRKPLPTSVSASGGRAAWCRSCVWTTPLFGKGLKLGQRLCYFNAMLHFLSGIPRLIFLTAPLAFLIPHAYIIYAPAAAIALYMLPHIFHSARADQLPVAGQVRHPSGGEVS